ncbi:MAG: tRNA (adenosine(37)-N6)-threonylcarbamoyltransferase complex transferase subunit TsaD [Candidatus Gastranaerophilales bacterium]|nr:tRNA (adenosine(37)-N6)-threonylcarbamoyltransferase complex transferase subunit TsaD [Candidatus Gastranaerophilales bacterium]
MIILGIESSCDETAAAIVKDGREVLANVVSSQIKIHEKFGGVVPEVAAREHLNSINLVIKEAYEKANIEPHEIDAFSSTVGPGLVGCLLVGMNAAKTLSLVHNKPYLGVNHLQAHVSANFIDTDLKPPFVCLLVSGGHSQIIYVKDYDCQEIIASTIDDAVGEVYDKVARLCSIPYPGGVLLDKMAAQGNKNAFNFPEARVGEDEFSFSGLKTAVLREVKKFKPDELPKNDIAASFQYRIADTLIKKTLNFANKLNCKKIALAGGVAANSELRKRMEELKQKGFETYAPQMKYCTDNAAMVASAAYFNPIKCENSLMLEVFSRA